MLNQVRVLLLSYLYFKLLSSPRFKTILYNIVKKFMRGMVNAYFGLLIFRGDSESKGFLLPSQTKYGFSTLYATLLHKLINEKFTELNEHILIERGLFI